MGKQQVCKPKTVKKTFNYPKAVSGSQTFLTGIRSGPRGVYITGSFREKEEFNLIGVVYSGDLSENRQCNWGELSYPASFNTTLYGPDEYCKDIFQAVGSYTIGQDSRQYATLYQGDLKGSGDWINISYPDSINSIAHSISNDIVVGNYDTQLLTGHAYIYDVETKEYHQIVKEGALSITAYSVLYRGHCRYLIVGGYFEDQIEYAYTVEWNRRTKKFTNWKKFSYNNDNLFNTHFNGVSEYCGTYRFTGDYFDMLNNKHAFYMEIKDCQPEWHTIEIDGNPTSGNSIYQDVVVGVYQQDGINGYLYQHFDH